jgi:hypothetical protein
LPDDPRQAIGRIQRPSRHQMSVCYAIGAALIAAGNKLEVPRWPVEYDPGIRCHKDLKLGSLPSDPRQWFDRSMVPALRCWPPNWPSAKRTRRVLIKLIEQARDVVVRAELDPGEVRAMLAEAGAPMPAADDLTKLAADCLTLALNAVYEKELFDWSLRKQGWRKVNEAAETMRRFLPPVIEELKASGFVERIPPIRQMLELLLLDNLDLSMPGYGPARRPWAEGALKLATSYIETVDPDAGWSREGPAVRFLALALSRAYRQQIGAAAIATELDRHRGEIFSRGTV